MLNTVFGYGQVRLEPVCAQSTERYGVSGLGGSDFVWTVRGGTIIEGDGTDTITIHWGDAPGDYSIEVMEYSIGGCLSVPSIANIEVRGPIVDLGFSSPEICFGDTMIFDAGTAYEEPYVFTWQDSSNQQLYYGYSTKEISLSVIDGDGCQGSDTVNLTVNDLPVVHLYEDTILCDYTRPLMIYYSQIMSDPENFSSAVWNLGGEITNDEYITILPVEATIDTLFVTIMDFKGCKQSDTMLVLPCEIVEIFKNMPNAITPGSGTEGVNDFWNIPHIDLFPNAILEIFDRWGRLVYHTEHVYEEPWDGKSKGRTLPMDSYYYVLNLNFGDVKPIVGTVNIIK
jgi:gliding motility-associated-like protein